MSEFSPTIPPLSSVCYPQVIAINGSWACSVAIRKPQGDTESLTPSRPNRTRELAVINVDDIQHSQAWSR